MSDNNESEIERLRAELVEHHRAWFYLQCHPWDATKLALEMQGLVVYERDAYGHIVGEGQPHPHAEVYEDDADDWDPEDYGCSPHECADTPSQHCCHESGVVDS